MVADEAVPAVAQRLRWVESVATAYIGLGANLAEPSAHIHAAIESLAQLPQTRLLVCSSLYRSAPIGLTEQPDFVNAVCALETSLPPPVLLRSLLEIEHEQGRVREVRGGPRTIDLDLLLYDTQQTRTEELTLPHPRMHERVFVLLPLCEIAPTLDIPSRGPVAALLAACTGQRVERLEN